MLENELKTIATELDQFRNTTNTKRSYPEELKQKVISLITQGLSLKKISDSTGIHSTTLNKWRGHKKKIRLLPLKSLKIMLIQVISLSLRDLAVMIF